MEELSKHEFEKARRRIIARAKKICHGYSTISYYSDAFHSSKNYGRNERWPEGWTVRHFTEISCGYLKKENRVTCLLKSPSGKCFIGEHNYGSCQVFELAGVPTTNLENYFLSSFVKAVRKKYPELNLSSCQYDDLYTHLPRPARSTLRKYFGSWPQVLQRAREFVSVSEKY